MLLNLHDLAKKHLMKIHGVAHIGGHTGEEYADYKRMGISEIIFFEPDIDSFKKLYDNTIGDNTVELWNCALGSKAGHVDMYKETANNGQSNSLLKPLKHLEYYPDIKFNEKTTVEVVTLDYIIGHSKSYKYNFINCDVQGFELEVFKGGSTVISSNIDYIYCEVNREPLYENCAMVDEIDEFLLGYKFSRVETKWTNQGWGDALYIKSK